MLEYNRVDESEGIDVNKINGLQERVIFYYWYFLEKNFKFQPKYVNVIMSYCKKL